MLPLKRTSIKSATPSDLEACPFTGGTKAEEAPPECPMHQPRHRARRRSDPPPPPIVKAGLKRIPTLSMMAHGPALLAGASDPVRFVGLVAKEAARKGEKIAGLSRLVGHHKVAGLPNIVGFERMAATIDPDLVQDMLTGPRAEDFGRAYDLKLVVARVLKESLLTTDGVPHDTRKKAYQKMFAGPALRRYFEAIKIEAKSLVDRWEARAARSMPIDVERDAIELTLAAQLRGLFSVTLPPETVKEIADGIGLIMEHSQREAQPPGKAMCLLHGAEHRACDEAAAKIRRLLGDVVAARRQEGPKDDLLDAFFDAKVQHTEGGEMVALTDEQIRDEVFTFLFAGHDTTGLAISNALQELAAHPEIQEQVAQEAQTQALGSELDFKQVPQMSLTNAVFKEGLRLHPTVPWGSREAKRDTEIGGYFIPKGTTVAYSALDMNRRQEAWGPDAEAFDPHRFLDGRPVPWDANFNAGQTKCIGFRFAELMGSAVLAEAVGRLEFRTVANKDPVYEHSITLVSKNPLVLQAETRDPSVPRQTGALSSCPKYVDVLKAAQTEMEVDTSTIGVTTFKTQFQLSQGLRPGTFSWRIAKGMAPKTLFVGPPFEPYERTEVIERIDNPAAALTKLEKEARRTGQKVIAIPNVAKNSPCIEKWTALGFRAIPTPPDMVLQLDGLADIDALRARIGSSKGGRWIRRCMEDFDAKGHTLERVDSYEDVLDEVYDCYRNVADKATIAFFEYEKAYFDEIKALGDDVDLMLARGPDGKVSGFTVGIMNGDRYEWGRVGVAPEYDRKDSVYFRLMISAVENAMKRGSSEVSFGPTSYGVKAKLGAEPRSMVMLAKSRGPLLRRLIDSGLKRGLFDHLDAAAEEKSL